MSITSILAIYALFWVMSAFLVMPFGLRTPQDTGHQTEPGHAESAPVNFNPRKITLRATILAAVFFALYYANYVYGWVGVEDLDITRL